MGPETSDDAGVFLIDEGKALVQTVDFFSPIVDDPYLFGQIAAANSLSDVYAMGALPLTALNIACFPTCLSEQEMGEILRGGFDKCQEAGVILLGGHTVENQEPKFGMAVTGIINPNQVWTNAKAKPGDTLIITKAIGTGILATALKAGMLDTDYESTMVESMRSLNKRAAEVLRRIGKVDACTDITGFGLMGHLYEMARAGKVTIVLEAGQVPVLPGTIETARLGLVPAGAYRNREFVGDAASIDQSIPLALQDVLFDPQTSGGLVVAVPGLEAHNILEQLHQAGVLASIIGRVERRGEKSLVVQP